MMVGKIYSIVRREYNVQKCNNKSWINSSKVKMNNDHHRTFDSKISSICIEIVVSGTRIEGLGKYEKRMDA